MKSTSRNAVVNRAGDHVVSRRVFAAVSTLLFLLVAGMVPDASAQERPGFWIGFGLGVGSVGASADSVAGTITGGRDIAAGVDLTVGWALDDQWLLGLEANVLSVPTDGGTLQLFFPGVLGTLTVFPRRASNFFVTGGVGMSFVDFELIDTPDRSLDGIEGKGLGLMAGVGYEVWVGKGFSVVPQLNVRYGQAGEISVGGITQFRRWKHDSIDATVSLMFHRPRRPSR